jgi:hypothetical protein
MTHDPDLLAIQRKRRREKRCLSCGTPTPRASLCKTCREKWCYCPRCEAVYPEANASARTRALGRCAIYCLPCSNTMRREAAGRRTWATYLAERQAQQHPQLRNVIRLYRAGWTHDAIAPAVGLSRGGLASLIWRARQRGQWPEKLRRVTR